MCYEVFGYGEWYFVGLRSMAYVFQIGGEFCFVFEQLRVYCWR